MELEKAPKQGEFYKDTEGNLYQILSIAIHANTKESMVVYQALFGGFYTYCLPYEIFTNEKESSYHFERVSRSTAQEINKNQDNALESFTNSADIELDYNSDVNRDLLAFLDAKLPEEKLEILYNIRERIDEKLLNSIEISLDIVSNDDDIDTRIDYIRSHLLKRAKYENTRLR